MTKLRSSHDHSLVNIRSLHKRFCRRDYITIFKFRKLIITFQSSLPSAGAGLVPALK